MKINRTLIAAFSLILFAINCTAQGKSLKVFISADMEGVDGVSTWNVQANAKGREFFRQLPKSATDAMCVD